MLKKVLYGAVLALALCGSAVAASGTIWGSPHASVTIANRIPVDTSNVSGPGYNSIDDILGLLNGDCTVTSAHITCSKTGGVSFAPIATSGSASDLSTGTLSAARLPLPTASTLGGVESLAPSGSKWLKSIGVDGVPTATQPQDADILFTDTVTGNSSNSKHGYVPKLPNDATKYYDGTGAFSVPAGGGGGGSGTVTSASVVSANGFSGSVATATTTPAITISTTISGMLKGAAGALTAAVSGTDYAPGTSALTTGIVKSTTTTGAFTIAVAGDFPTLNQNTTGSAASATTAGTLTGALSANQLLGSLTAVAPTGQSVPSCSTSASALLWTSGTGFSCNTSIAAATVTTNANLTGDVISSGNATTIAANAVTDAKLATGTANSLLGYNNSGAAATVTIGSGLSLSGGSLTATGSGGTVTSVSVATANGVSGSVATSTTTPAITLTLGAITPTTVNKVTLTAPATGSTLTIANGKTLTANNSLTLAGTDLTTMTFPAVSDTVAALGTTEAFTKSQSIAPVTDSISTATFTPDFSASNNHNITLVHASCPCTLANPTNIVAGQSGVIVINQSATGSDTIGTYGTKYVFTNAASPVLSTAASAVDELSYYVVDTTHIRVAPLTSTAVAGTTATATPGTNVTSCTCATAACTNLRGTYTIVGGTATTGTICGLAWTATPAAYACTATMNGGASAFGIGNSVATTTGMNITAGVSVAASTFTVNYSCQP